MAVNPAIATLWSAKLLENLDKAHVYGKFTNQDYEGEISKLGDVLKIFSVGRPTVNNTTVGNNLTYQRIRPTPQVLVIDQDKNWAIQEDDLEKMLEKVSTMTRLMKNGAYQFADAIDQFIAALCFVNQAAANALTPVTVGNGAFDKKAYDLLVDMRAQFKAQNIMESDGLGVAVPPWFMGMLRKDLRFSGYGTDANRATARGEPVGDVEGMVVYESNNVPTPSTVVATPTVASLTTDTYVIEAVWNGAVTFGNHLGGIDGNGAVQTIDSTQNVNSFDDLMRSRIVFGATVTHPEGVVTCNVQQGTSS